MDLLQSLNLDDLPEQQTRTVHLIESQPDFELALGFDSCCVCGKANPSVECAACHRVKYCSMECQGKDSEPSMVDDEQALGHTSVICAILALCNDDEAIEAGKVVVDLDKRSAATDRLSSEFESYPATLANVIMDGPCYQDCLMKKAGNSLKIHVVGASLDSEFWHGHPDSSQEQNVFKGYAEALAEVAERHKLQEICLCFVGPDSPDLAAEVKLQIPNMQQSTSGCALRVTSVKADYNKTVQSTNEVGEPDVAVFFNPGFTCPDYSWGEALSSIPHGTPCLLTTNTELEGLADVQYLVDGGFIKELPSGLVEIIEGAMDMDGSGLDSDSFFSVNPYSGNRVRQSGTMANDLYVKNRWIFGGVFGSTREASAKSSNPGKKARTETHGNTKELNPALV